LAGIEPVCIATRIKLVKLATGIKLVCIVAEIELAKLTTGSN
jgi:hypothetical protein